MSKVDSYFKIWFGLASFSIVFGIVGMTLGYLLGYGTSFTEAPLWIHALSFGPMLTLFVGSGVIFGLNQIYIGIREVRRHD